MSARGVHGSDLATWYEMMNPAYALDAPHFLPPDSAIHPPECGIGYYPFCLSAGSADSFDPESPKPAAAAVLETGEDTLT